MMESPSETTVVTILDKEYRVSCPADQTEALHAAARYLSDKMRDIRSVGKVIGIERIAVMAALNISYELMHTRSAAETEKNETREHLNLLLGKLDSALISVEK